MKLETHTTRIGLSGKPYPRCQHSDGKAQCNKSTYADKRCYQHYQLKQRSAARSGS